MVVDIAARPYSVRLPSDSKRERKLGGTFGHKPERRGAPKRPGLHDTAASIADVRATGTVQLAAWGWEAGLGGHRPVYSNKQVVFMGTRPSSTAADCDLETFKTAKISLSRADNKTAMTGHQTTPALDQGLMGERTFAQNIDAVIAGITDQTRSGATVVRVNPAERESYRELLEKVILQDGVKVVVADKECGITYHRRAAREERRILREKGFLPEKRFINITHEVCENCLECTKASMPRADVCADSYGRKVQIDFVVCSGWGVRPCHGVDAEDGLRSRVR